MEDLQKCPHCGGEMKKYFQAWQIIVAILFFPIGIVVLLIPRKWKCTVCGREAEQSYPREVNNSVPVRNRQTVHQPVNKSVNWSTRPTRPAINEKTLMGQIKRNDTLNKAEQTSAYNFYSENKAWIIPSAIILCVISIFVAASVHKYSQINSLYEEAVKYQEEGYYSTALYCLDEILKLDDDNERATELYPVIEEAYHQQTVEDNINKAVSYKESGNYISAYNYAKSAYSNAEEYGYEEEKATAQQLMNELLPLKEQQETEKAAKAEAEKKEREEAEAKAKQEAEAKAKQETEAKAKQEAEAKAKQETEAKAKQEAEAKAKQETEAKAKQETEAKAKTKTQQQSKPAANQNGTASSGSSQGVTLDATKQGKGFSISYPSNYVVEDNYDDASPFTVTDPASLSYISVVPSFGAFNSPIIDEEFAKAALCNYDLGTHESDIQETTLNGLKCYKCEARIVDYFAANIELYLTGGDNSMFIICVIKTDNISDTASKTIDNMLSSFKLN